MEYNKDPDLDCHVTSKKIFIFFFGQLVGLRLLGVPNAKEQIR